MLHPAQAREMRFSSQGGAGQNECKQARSPPGVPGVGTAPVVVVCWGAEATLPGPESCALDGE